MTTEKFQKKGTKDVIPKDPNAVLDYVVDFTDFLTPVDDEIADLDVTVTGGLVVDSSSFAGKIATVWLSGGDLTVAGAYASATFRITTNNVPPRIEDKTVYFDIKHK